MTSIVIKITEAVKDFFRGSPTRLKISLSGRISLDSSSAEFFQHFAPIFSALEKGSESIEVEIDLTNADFIYPSALLFLLMLREIQGLDLHLVVSEGSAVHKYLLYCEADKYFYIPALLDESKSTAPLFESEVFPLQEGNKLGNTQKIAQDFIDMLNKHQPLSEMVQSTAIDSIDELLRNISQHSGYSRYLILGQSYINSHRIRLCLYDNGIGIRRHITRLKYDETHPVFRSMISVNRYNEMAGSSANIAIEEAAKYMISGTDYSNNSGAGLDFLIRKLSVPTNGSVIILSENGLVAWKKGDIVESIALPFSIKGTLVSVTIDCNPDYILRYQKEVLDNGK